MNPYLLDLMEAEALEHLEVEVYYDTSWDELWSYVASKANPRWRWYLLERRSGVIVAWENGPREDAALEALLAKVAHLPLRVCYTDDLGAYERLLPARYAHVVERRQTWKIERRPLNLRTHLKRLSRKTLCFSKSEHVHDNVIGLYIERHYYRHGRFRDAVLANQRL